MVATAFQNALLYEDIQHHADELDKRVQERTRELEDANRELEAFSYSASHDLRAPLRSINGFARLLQKGQADRLDEKGREHLDRVRSESQRMSELIDALLDLSHMARTNLRREVVDLSEMAKAIAAELQASEPNRDAEFLVTPGLRTRGDVKLLRQVLHNLLGNAWKFTGTRGRTEIELGATLHEDETTFYVRDNGVGFDMAYVEKLFGAFQRLHRTDDFEGTGIGLATVQRIVHRHGGRVWAEGEVDKGATFYFILEKSERSSRSR